jgi:hypothetical protein
MGTVTITFSAETIAVDKDGEKIDDLGQIVEFLEKLWKAAQNLYTVNMGLAKLEGSRLDYLTQLQASTSKTPAPK